MSHLAAADCKTMAELRVEIDSIDQALVKLFALRTTYIDRAVTLKQFENLPARIPDRVEQVIHNVVIASQTHGFDSALATRIWRDLIEWSIAHESKQLGN